jgi:hypothetical protein
MKKIIIKFNDQKLPTIAEAYLDGKRIVSPNMLEEWFFEDLLKAVGYEVEYEFSEEL